MKRGRGFAVWVTGLPGSGKSTLSRIVREKLEKTGVRVTILESDELRTELMPNSSYGLDERELFYNVLAYLGKSLSENGVNVIFDATANLRKFREKARLSIKNFLEVYVRCPLEECIRRDPKGIYALARKGKATTVPGLQVEYEKPLAPEVIVDTRRETADSGGERIVKEITERFLTKTVK